MELPSEPQHAKILEISLVVPGIFHNCEDTPQWHSIGQCRQCIEDYRKDKSWEGLHKCRIDHWSPCFEAGMKCIELSCFQEKPRLPFRPAWMQHDTLDHSRIHQTLKRTISTYKFSFGKDLIRKDMRCHDKEKGLSTSVASGLSTKSAWHGGSTC